MMTATVSGRERGTSSPLLALEGKDGGAGAAVGNIEPCKW